MKLGQRSQRMTRVMQQWMQRAIVYTGSFLAILEWVSLTSIAEDRLSPHVMRPPDAMLERLERSRPKQEATDANPPSAHLHQSDAVVFAKKLVRKELGRSYDDYDLGTTVFDPMTKFWSVTFIHRASRHPSDACLLVLLNDENRVGSIRPCS